MRWLLVIWVFVLPAAAFAQDGEVDPYAECGKVLLSAPANELAKYTVDDNFGGFDNTIMPVLLGNLCSVEQITAYMKEAGWVIDLKSRSGILEENGLRRYETLDESHLYTADSVLFFRLPERRLWRLFSNYRGVAYFHMFERKIVWVRFGAPILLGG